MVVISEGISYGSAWNIVGVVHSKTFITVSQLHVFFEIKKHLLINLNTLFQSQVL